MEPLVSSEPLWRVECSVCGSSEIRGRRPDRCGACGRREHPNETRFARRRRATRGVRIDQIVDAREPLEDVLGGDI